MKNQRLAIALAALSVLSAACSASEEGRNLEAKPARPAVAPHLLSVTAGDFYYKTERTIPAGMTTVRMTGAGREMHHVTIVKFAPGHGLEELQKMSPEAGIPDWVTFVGGPNAPAPGGTSEVTVELEPGEYALLCVIPSGDGVPHFMKGMVVPLTVTAERSAAPAPVADAELKLVDYGFDFQPALTAGRHVIRVENAARQPHEIFIARLEPGRSAPELLDWIMKQQGPPPAVPMGGTTVMAPGVVNYLTLDLAPGRYALYCFVPDARDGKEHVAHGMMREIEVK